MRPAYFAYLKIQLLVKNTHTHRERSRICLNSHSTIVNSALLVENTILPSEKSVPTRLLCLRESTSNGRRAEHTHKKNTISMRALQSEILYASFSYFTELSLQFVFHNCRADARNKRRRRRRESFTRHFFSSLAKGPYHLHSIESAAMNHIPIATLVMEVFYKLNAG